MIIQSSESTKSCAKCGVIQPVEEFGLIFSKNKQTKYRASYCKKCNVIHSRQWRIKNPEKAKTKTQTWRNNHYKKYGITLQKYEELVQLQNNLCAICGRPPESRNLHVDHCHKTGKIRGLLCRRCNRGIGILRDSTEIMTKAISYLEKFK